MTLENERLKLQRMERQLLILGDQAQRLRELLERAVCPECGAPHSGIAHPVLPPGIVQPIDKLPRTI